MMKPNPPTTSRSLPTAASADVPTFGCVVYVSTLPDGRKKGRVANIEGIEQIAGSERELLQRIVPTFKKTVSDYLAAGESIPWVDPMPAIAADEQKRFLPVHL
ncbi:hypothetical protein [Novipirellula caenicola]|uniref:Uncharacterized protein n=1 Tax=Novipirellula caenicola TaxID=1536901 RepID=A0ABP9VQE5_9BACT